MKKFLHFLFYDIVVKRRKLYCEPLDITCDLTIFQYLVTTFRHTHAKFGIRGFYGILIFEKMEICKNH